MKQFFTLVLIALISHNAIAQCNAPNVKYGISISDKVVSFTDSTLSDSTITNWIWDFGDGNTSTQQHPQHTYAGTGTYLTCLTVFTACSADSICKYVTTTCSIPDTKYAVAVSDKTVNFTDTTAATPSPITNRIWDFGDGNTSTQQNPQHTYAATGTYKTCLTTVNACGADSICKFVTTTCALPDTKFSYTLNEKTATFMDTTAATPSAFNTWIWEFGDGNTSTQQNPQHTYTNTGTYLTCLIVGNACGADSICKPTYVTCDTVKPNFTAQTSYGKTVLFTNTSTGSGQTLLWTFDDADTSTTSAPSKTFDTIGSHTTCLKVSNYCSVDSVCNVHVITDSIVGIEPIHNTTIVNIYPSPFNNILSIEVSAASTISLHSITGALVHTANVQQGVHTLVTKHLNKGIYFVRVSNADGAITKKVIKN